MPSPQSLTGTPRSLQHAPLPAQVVRDALPLRRDVSDLLPVEQLRVLHVLTIAGMPRPHNTHSATISCRLSSPIMSATPNAYWRTCSMRCISVPSLCLEQTLPSSQSTAWMPREAADRSSVCGRSKCAETTATLTPSDISTHSTLPHKRAVPWEREVRRTVLA
ncbi:hypothetical protein TcCL_NonESM12902 [Trypanosoma cruzi]|nr:hypothetical protein TcCL_NonESM12902 [Trypanosoma cruzi]